MISNSLIPLLTEDSDSTVNICEVIQDIFQSVYNLCTFLVIVRQRIDYITYQSMYCSDTFAESWSLVFAEQLNYAGNKFHVGIIAEMVFWHRGKTNCAT